MSLPIPNAALIRGATRLAGDVASRVSQAIGFDEVLRGGSADPVEAGDFAGDQTSETTLTDQLVKAVRSLLHESGIATNQSLRLSVTEDGGMLVEENHPRAAEIEALLSQDRGLVETARRLYRSSGGQSAIGLTIPSGPGNIMHAAGGYPNW